MARCFICTSQITIASCRKSFSSNYLEHTQSSQHKILLYNRCSWFSQLYTLHVVAQCIITKSEFFLLYFLVIIAHYNTKKQEKIKTEPGVKIELVTGHGLLQAFRWWGAGKKLGRGRKIDEGKNRPGKGPAPVSPRVSFCARCIQFNLLPSI